jgi:hypothetical protein
MMSPSVIAYDVTAAPLKTFIVVTVHRLVQQEQQEQQEQQAAVFGAAGEVGAGAGAGTAGRGGRWAAPTVRLKLAEEEEHCKCSSQSNGSKGEFLFKNAVLRLPVPTLHRKPMIVSVEDLNLGMLDPLNKDAKKAKKRGGSAMVTRGCGSVPLRPSSGRIPIEIRVGGGAGRGKADLQVGTTRAGNRLVGMLEVSVGIESEAMTAAEVKKLEKAKKEQDKMDARERKTLAKEEAKVRAKPHLHDEACRFVVVTNGRRWVLGGGSWLETWAWLELLWYTVTALRENRDGDLQQAAEEEEYAAAIAAQPSSRRETMNDITATATAAAAATATAATRPHRSGHHALQSAAAADLRAGHAARRASPALAQASSAQLNGGSDSSVGSGADGQQWPLRL